MIDIEWADPPDPKGGRLTRGEQRAFAEKLKERPGRWAMYPTHAAAAFHLGEGGSTAAVRALASRINRGKQSAFGSGFEAVSRNGVVYVRYVGVADRNAAPGGCINRDPKHLEAHTAAECAAYRRPE